MQQGAAGYAILGGTLLAAGANTKNEGVVAAAAVLVAAGGAVVFGDRGRWRPWLAAAVLAAAGTAPTFLWRSSQHLRGSDVAPLGDVLHWNYLVDRLDRVPKSFSALFDQMADPGRWIYIVPCLLALVIVCLIRGVARREAAFYLAVPTLMVLGLVFVYWTGNPEIGYWLTYSADRTITGVVFVCGVGLVHLSALVLGEVSRRPDGAAP
jgi:hypothetical protein